MVGGVTGAYHARDGVPRVATVMTQQYLAGELSVLLAEMQATVSDRVAVRAAARLRGEAETLPLTELGMVAARALDLINAVCWESLTRGDTATFCRQAAVAAELYEFGVCAGLLDGR